MTVQGLARQQERRHGSIGLAPLLGAAWRRSQIVLPVDASANDPVAFYQGCLERLRKSGPEGAFRLKIAEVAFFQHGYITGWFFSSSDDGTLRRKCRKNLTCSALAARFTRTSGAFPGAVVALAIVQPSADAPLSVAALDGPGLAYLAATHVNFSADGNMQLVAGMTRHLHDV